MLRVVLSNASYGLLAPILLYKKNEKPYFSSEKKQLFKRPVYALFRNENNDRKEAFKKNEKNFTYLQKYKDFVYSPQILFTFDSVIKIFYIKFFNTNLNRFKLI